MQPITNPRGEKQFVGFGFGPIQSALFLFEAYRSGNFRRFVVAEVDADLVQAVRANDGKYTINIAHPDRIEQVTVEGVELYNPRDEADRAKVAAAVAGADEMATALPSIRFYDTGGAAGVAGTIAAGLAHRPADRPLLIYAAENHNHAAEALAADIAKHTQPPAGVQVLNTVVGKMSGVITDPAEIDRLGLATLTPGLSRAVLVEAFNRILISRVELPGVDHAIDVFVPKDDLLPFEEAKLYGHNAVHALIGYLSHRRGLVSMDQAAAHDDIIQTARGAFLDESGAALCRKHAGLGDALFTPDGYRAYAEDLLERMVNPHLNDLVARVIRDPARKLGYSDRLFGTMRLALEQGVTPTRMARGAAAAVRHLIDTGGDDKNPPASLPAPADAVDRPRLASLLTELWADEADAHADKLIDLTHQALGEL